MAVCSCTGKSNKLFDYLDRQGMVGGSWLGRRISECLLVVNEELVVDERQAGINNSLRPLNVKK